MIRQAPFQPHTEQSSLVDLLQWRAHHQPNQQAYTFLINGETETLHLTYADLDCQARSIAAYLQSIIPCGERAILLYPQGLEFIAAFLGCFYAGIVAVPAYPPRRNQKMSRLQSIVADAQPQIVLTTTSLLGTLKQGFDQISHLKTLKTVATDALGNDQAADWNPPPIEQDTLAFLQYTSGSTGTPKGVMVSHGNILHNSECIKQAFELSSDSVSVTWLPSFHDMGLIDGIIQPLYTGFLGILMSPAAFIQKPIRWLQAISHYQATHSGGPNLGYELCLQQVTSQQQQSLDLRHWCSAYSGAEPVRQQTLEQFITQFTSCGFEPQFFYPCYGMAEATLMVSGGNMNAAPVYTSVQADELERHRIVETDVETDTEQNLRHFVGCGHPWLENKVVIVDPDQLTPCKPGQVGEIWVSGPSIAQGYWHQPEHTQETFQAYLAETHEGPFLRTGDLGFLQDDELFITGRIKDLIIIWGRNHYPQDIELTVSESHPALRPEWGAAFSVEVDGIERLVITQEVERSSLRHLNVDEIVTAIRQAVSEQHDLQVYAIALLKTVSLPKTSSGKVQRHLCRANFLANRLNIVGEWKMSVPTAPSTSETIEPSIITEEAIEDWLINQLAQIFQLDPDEMDIEQPFSQYGLDSSVAMSLTGKLGNWLGCDLEPTLFWEYPNIEALTQYLTTLIDRP